MLKTLQTASPRMRRHRPWLKLLTEVLTLAGPLAELQRHSERPWQSATFSGTRHGIALAFNGTAAVEQGEQLIAALPDHEFTVPGQLVADAAITLVEHENGPEPRLTVEAELLLLEDC
jgi:hypothetical protein